MSNRHSKNSETENDTNSIGPPSAINYSKDYQQIIRDEKEEELNKTKKRRIAH